MLDHQTAAISSWNPEKNAAKIQHFWGDIRYSPSFRWILGLRASAGAVHLGCSRPLGPPVCVVYPTASLKVLNFFSSKLFKTGSKWAPTDVHAICFRRKSCSFCTGEGCPLPNTLVGRFDFEMQTPNFHTARMEGASQTDI